MIIPQCVLSFVLLSCVLPGHMGSDVSPEEAGLVNLRLRRGVILDQVLDSLSRMLRSNILQATDAAHGELSSRLDAVQSSLERLTQLTSRLEAVERTVASVQETFPAVSGCQLRLQETLASVTSRDEDLQTSLSDVIARQGDLQTAVTSLASSQHGVQQTLEVLERGQNNMTDTVEALSERLDSLPGQREIIENILNIVPTRKEVQHNLRTQCRDEGLSDALALLSNTQQEIKNQVSAQNSRLDGLANSIAALSGSQQDVSEAIGNLPTKRYIQENIAGLSSRLDWTPIMERLIATQDTTIQMLSSHSTQLVGVADSLAEISDRQQTVERALSSQSEWRVEATSSLSALSEQQLAARQALSEQSVLLADMAGVVSGTPAPAGQPSLVTGRLLGEPCRGDADCNSLRSDTVCGSDGRCQCAAGLQQVAGQTCRPYPRLSEPCRATSDCRGATELSVCSENHCACQPGLLNFNNSVCRSGLGVGEPCDRDSDCPGQVGLTCSAGACAVRTCDAPRSGSNQYRLVGGSSCSDGLLQFTFNSGQLWQYVCDSNWTSADATVACRYLGFTDGEALPLNSTAVSEANFLSVKDFVCDGAERSLSRCRRVYGRDSCAAGELARVQCS